MKLLLSVGLATSYGLLVRLFFGFLEDYLGVMSMAFLALAPCVIGFLTVYIMPRKNVTSKLGAFFVPWLSCAAILVVTMFFQIEGLICWVMIFPFFAILAGLGGIIAYHFKNKNKLKDDEELNDFLKDITKPQLSLLLLLPVFFGFIEGERTLIRKDYHINEKIVIKAPKEKVWNHIVSVGEIKSEELNASSSDWIGFPTHIRTSLDTLALGATRKAVYEKGLFFDEEIIDMEPNKKLTLKIITQPEKVPPTVMDEHIVIGGKYVDIMEDSYNIIENGEQTELWLSSKFFINTPFNWYAGIWADYLMRDILQKELERIKSRAEE